ncbi:MAG: hypothetical protein SFX73_38845 [Kofleriaceae bacterium]|nr:hypothetical protein [Kofleriaceae bacterium]
MSEWNERELCPDGACTGVIGNDGTCKVCGKHGLAPVPAPHTSELDGDEDSEHDEDHDEDHDDESSGADSGAEEPWVERELCSDGACVGVIDETGACKVCGKKSPTWKPRPSLPSATDDATLRAAAADLAASVPAADVAALTPAPVESSDDDAPRALCPDGACVGVIGKDGKCKLCGAEAA